MSQFTTLIFTALVAAGSVAVGASVAPSAPIVPTPPAAATVVLAPTVSSAATPAAAPVASMAKARSIIQTLPSRDPSVVLPIIRKLQANDTSTLLGKILGPIGTSDSETVQTSPDAPDTTWRRYVLADGATHITAVLNDKDEFIELKILAFNNPNLSDEVVISNPAARRSFPKQILPIALKVLPHPGERWAPKVMAAAHTATSTSNQLLDIYALAVDGIAYDLTAFQHQVLWITTADTAFTTPEGHTMQTPFGLFQRAYGEPRASIDPNDTFVYFRFPSGWSVAFDRRTSNLPQFFQLGR